MENEEMITRVQYASIVSQSNILATTLYEDSGPEYLLVTPQGSLAILWSTWVGPNPPNQGHELFFIDYVDVEGALDPRKHDFHLLDQSVVNGFPDAIRDEWIAKKGRKWFPGE